MSSHEKPPTNIQPEQPTTGQTETGPQPIVSFGPDINIGRFPDIEAPTSDVPSNSEATPVVEPISTEVGASNERSKRLSQAAARLAAAAATGYAVAKGASHVGQAISSHASSAHAQVAAFGGIGARVRKHTDRVRKTVEERPAKRAEDAKFYRDSAKASLERMGWAETEEGSGQFVREVEDDYDPTDRFEEAHLTRRLGVPKAINVLTGEEVSEKDELDRLHPRTNIQDTANRRNNNRAIRIHTRDGRIEALAELYEDHPLDDKGKLADKLKDNRNTFGQRRAIRKAGKELRKHNRGNNRDHDRLLRAAKGQDFHGRILADKTVEGPEAEPLTAEEQVIAEQTAWAVMMNSRSGHERRADKRAIKDLGDTIYGASWTRGNLRYTITSKNPDGSVNITAEASDGSLYGRKVRGTELEDYVTSIGGSI